MSLRERDGCVGEVFRRRSCSAVDSTCGPSATEKPEADEDVLDLAAHLRDQVQVARRPRRRARERDVDAVLEQPPVELGAGERLEPGLDQGRERLTGPVRGRPDGAPLLGRQLGHAAQQLRQLGTPAQVVHAQVLEGGGIRRGGHGRLAFGRDLGDTVERAHRGAILVTSYNATVAAIAALSESPATCGIERTSSHCARTSGGSPVALAADQQREVALARPGTAARTRRRRAPRPAAGARPRRRKRATFAPKIAPTDARTAFGEYGSAHSRPERQAIRAERVHRPQHGADVARIPDPPERDHAPGRRDPALLVDADDARALGDRRDRREQLRLRPRAIPNPARLRSPARPARRAV